MSRFINYGKIYGHYRDVKYTEICKKCGMTEWVYDLIQKIKTNDIISQTEESVLLTGQERFYIEDLLFREYVKML